MIGKAAISQNAAFNLTGAEGADSGIPCRRTQKGGGKHSRRERACKRTGAMQCAFLRKGGATAWIADAK